MSSGGTSLRKALGALKDTTTVSLAKVNSDYKELDIAIVKATNHYERPAREKNIRAIFAAISATRPRADVAYCIHALARRLTRTHNWAVALKTLIVIHRALREVDPTFHEELINYGRSRSHMLNMSHFKDDSSPNAWDYSAWVRTYALFLEERLECFRVLKYDIEMDRPRTKDLDTAELLEQLPALQQLLFRVLGCQPQGAAVHNFVIRLALSMVASESVNIYQAISDGTVNLVDKFFEMQRSDALKALDIYRRAGQQAERLSEFYEVCKSLDVGRGERFIKIEQPPASFLQAMEEYVREAPLAAAARKDQADKPKEVLAIEYKKTPEVEEKRSPSPPPPEPEKVEKVEEPIVEQPDLLNLNDPIPVASELDEKNALALAIVPVEQTTTAAPVQANGATGWELALVTAPSSNESAAAASKLAGGLDKLTLDSLYDDAIRRSNQNVSYNPWEQAPVSGAMMQQPAHDPFYASNMVAAPYSVQMATMANQQQAFMFQQQQQQQQQQMMMMAAPQQQPSNPFSSYEAPVHPYSSDHSPINGGGVKDDLSVIGETIGRRLRGVAAFLAPPPAVTTAELGTEEEEEEELKYNKAVSEISRFASSFLQFPDQDDHGGHGEMKLTTTTTTECRKLPMRLLKLEGALLRKLQNNKNAQTGGSSLDASQESGKFSETIQENVPSEEKVSESVNAAEGLKITSGEDNTEQWVEEAADISSGSSVSGKNNLEHEEDISFSALGSAEQETRSSRWFAESRPIKFSR
ncbi:hypothetical protein V6N12_064195 [Hibiscus sabdariffa]|uniref:ENTH domain-containing protein n=1 Tax=Hibiscus sabdariffa TaxID=183260 RepID=A0ABR2G5L4_9ROSI